MKPSPTTPDDQRRERRALVRTCVALTGCVLASAAFFVIVYQDISLAQGIAVSLVYIAVTWAFLIWMVTGNARD